MRRFGWIKINPKFVEKLGPEPFAIRAPKFLKLLKGLKKPIKCAIMNQEVIAGVGNIYANDALWEARINPKVPSNKVTSDKAKVLLKKIILVLKEGIKYGGASMSDYVDTRGMGGTYQDHFRVYKQEGKKCKRCKSVIKKIVLGGRGTYYCEVCQPY
jgi:formamidopyrimidine-DNA glycosylase